MASTHGMVAPELVNTRTAEAPVRVLSADVLRGLTMALMILVNDPGDWGHVFGQLDHAEWNGWTLTDLVFPTFLFLVGASTVFSVSGRLARGDCRKTLVGHIAARAGKIALLDWVLGYFPRMDWRHLRLFGVLTRIGVCYLLGALVLLAVWRTRRKAWLVAGVVAVLLVGYWVLLRWVPVPGYGLPGRDVAFMDPAGNLAAWTDRAFTGWTQRWLHTGSLYNRVRDPEGVLSTLPAVATTLLGALAGMALRAASRGDVAWSRVRRGLLLAGVCGFVAGEVWGRWFPVTRDLWTSSYVLVVAGLAAIALAGCSLLVDARPEPWPRVLRVGSWPWFVFGSNAIAAYVVSVVLVKLGLFFHLRDAEGDRHTLWSLAYTDVFARHGSDDWTSLAFALAYVCVCFVPVWLLWRRRIFLKI